MLSSSLCIFNHELAADSMDIESIRSSIFAVSSTTSPNTYIAEILTSVHLFKAWI